MSVCRKLPDGTVQKIAGHTILLDANASEVRKGTFSCTVTKDHCVVQEVEFSDPMPDTDYVVVIEPTNHTNWGTLETEVYDKTTTGFRIRCWLDAPGSAVAGVWTAWKPVKIEGYTELQNKVNNPDDTPTIDSMNLVTSDGVARAIENASAVWKGTKAEWNALPAADKKKYDLAVLLDSTLVKAVDRETGDENDVANLNKIVHLTKAEYDAMPSHDPDTYYMITDDTTVMSPGYPKPDWANAVAITKAQVVAGYEAPSDGMIAGYGTAGADTSIDFSVNNVVVSRTGYYPNRYAAFSNTQVPVNKGDIFKSDGALDSAYFHFVPWK